MRALLAKHAFDGVAKPFADNYDVVDIEVVRDGIFYVFLMKYTEKYGECHELRLRVRELIELRNKLNQISI